VSANAVLEHRQGSLGRRLQRNRLKVAIAIAAVEGLLVLLGAVSWWVVVLLAVGAVVFYLQVGRDHRNPDVVNGTWTLAVSQLIVIVVPVLAAIAVALAAILVVVLAGLALAALLLDRRR
jgi:hypothetical protein